MVKTNIIWHTLSRAKAIQELKTSTKGLEKGEVKKRLEKYGLNILAKDHKFSFALVFFNQFKSALVYILVIAGFISLAFGKYIDAIVIFVAVFLNVIVGFVQEYKANKSLEKLNKVIKQKTLVLRAGQERALEAQYLVPGDIVILKAGDRVSADLRLLISNNLEVNEASLTGESWPVKKKVEVLKKGVVLAERNNLLFMSTLIVEGRGEGVVVETGLKTEIGKITTLLKETRDEKTPLQKKLDKFAQNITKLVIFASGLIFVLGIIRNNPWEHMFTLSIAVAVSAIPEGLLIGMTMILTVGMQRILKSKGLVRKLIAAETLGSTTLICTDKTGTLTEGEMRVVKLSTATYQLDLLSDSFKDLKDNKEVEELMQIALLCNDSVIQNFDLAYEDLKFIGSPTEKALLISAASYLNIKKVKKEFKRREEIPFDSQRKYMVTRHSLNSKQDIIFIKGAPEKILNFSNYYLKNKKKVNLTEKSIKYFKEEYEKLSKQGLRILSGAYKIITREEKELIIDDKLEDFIFVGIWGLSDPLRPEIKRTLEKTKKAGIKTIIITGDNKFTTQRIAQDLGFPVDNESIMTGDELLKIDDQELDKRITKIKIYARVSPSDKLRIVQAWQKRGEVVAMTGDGVNDAPAIKAADIGVVVANASDVAKETADLILLDSNFTTIVKSIGWGRVIFANIRKVILYLLSDSFSEVLIILGSLLLGLPFPLLVSQILWINLVSDGLPNLALTMEPEEEDIMSKDYQEHNKELLGMEGKVLVGIISIVTALSTIFLFYYFWQKTGDQVLARTVTFTALGIDTLFYVFSIRNLRENIFKSKPFRNIYLNFAVLGGLALQLMAIYLPFFNKFLNTVPLYWSEWSLILIFVFLVITMIEFIKYLFNKYYQY